MHKDPKQCGRPSRETLRRQMTELLNVEDIRGIEVFSLINVIANLSEALDCQSCSEIELSGPRWRLMLRLLMEEKRGNTQGITPTDLSQSQRVSKNTISSLLRGLEEQGLIAREVDSRDYRVFRIRLTDQGRAMILNNAPVRIESLNRLTSGLSLEECEQLTLLLEKLAQPLMAQAFKYHN
jgi:DNA-binding MarR family transcriptional regulator